MKSINLKPILIFSILIITFQSCSNDDSFTDNSDSSEDFDETIVVTNSTTQLIAEWGQLWLTLDQYTVGMRPNTVTRSLAYIHLTGFETAIPFMDNYTTNTQRLNGFNINTNVYDDDVNLDLALNTTYAIAIDHFMHSLEPGIRQNISTFQNEKEVSLIEGLSETEIENSERWGRHVAQRVISYSQSDRDAEEQIVDQKPNSYVAPVGTGLWSANVGEDAWFPYWREIRTFAITPEKTSSIDFDSALQYSTDTSSEYYNQMNKVYQINGAAANGNEDLWIAEFWADDVEGLMISPPGRQYSITNQLIEQYDLDYDKALELLLRLGFALNDAAVSAWDDKYTYNKERPSNYITEYIDADLRQTYLGLLMALILPFQVIHLVMLHLLVCLQVYLYHFLRPII
ncbi:hypothetical protein [Winogradskyella sp. PG-2]|uniref:hypothetical protein n=1 Tax=Winogradskyella sp. PG-2 TaxID=754409 RepID=UPI0004587DA6|nr:hypothetical protein [Winogradskyella sp. PG-2]BAO77322.1 vanadium chloroperoxidase [Winogradskyella sp. PG-2]